MFIKKILLNFIIISFFICNSYSEEIQIESENINVKDDGNLIYAINSNIFIPSKQIKIYSDKAEYNKKNIIIFTDKVFFEDLKKYYFKRSKSYL